MLSVFQHVPQSDMSIEYPFEYPFCHNKSVHNESVHNESVINESVINESVINESVQEENGKSFSRIIDFLLS